MFSILKSAILICVNGFIVITVAVLNFLYVLTLVCGKSTCVNIHIFFT